jgi:hypothetical protein
MNPATNMELSKTLQHQISTILGKEYISVKYATIIIILTSCWNTIYMQISQKPAMTYANSHIFSFGFHNCNFFVNVLNISYLLTPFSLVYELQ